MSEEPVRKAIDGLFEAAVQEAQENMGGRAEDERVTKACDEAVDKFGVGWSPELHPRGYHGRWTPSSHGDSHHDAGHEHGAPSPKAFPDGTVRTPGNRQAHAKGDVGHPASVGHHTDASHSDGKGNVGSTRNHPGHGSETGLPSRSIGGQGGGASALHAEAGRVGAPKGQPTHDKGHAPGTQVGIGAAELETGAKAISGYRVPGGLANAATARQHATAGLQNLKHGAMLSPPQIHHLANALNQYRGRPPGSPGANPLRGPEDFAASMLLHRLTKPKAPGKPNAAPAANKIPGGTRTQRMFGRR